MIPATAGISSGRSTTGSTERRVGLTGAHVAMLRICVVFAANSPVYCDQTHPLLLNLQQVFFQIVT
jgi:hypothetical protein